MTKTKTVFMHYTPGPIVDIEPLGQGRPHRAGDGPLLDAAARSDVMFELTRPKFGQKITWEEWISEFEKGNNIAAPK